MDTADLAKLILRVMKELRESFGRHQQDVNHPNETCSRSRSTSIETSGDLDDSEKTRHSRRSYISRSRRPRNRRPRSRSPPSGCSSQGRSSQERMARNGHSDSQPPRSGYFRDRQVPPSRKGKSPLWSRNWADRMEDSEEERMDYSELPVYPDSDEEEGGCKLVEVSETTKALLQSKCTQNVSNDKRKRVRARYPQPKVAATRTPKLDESFKQIVPATTKAADKNLAKIQTFILDAVAPLTAPEEKKLDLTLQDATDAALN